MADRRSPSLRRPIAGLAFVAACVVAAAGCGDFQIAEFTRASTTTIEIEAAPTTLVESTVESVTSSTLRPVRYAVEPNDTLGSIAQKFGVSVALLMQANAITDGNQLRAGQELVIPDPDDPVTPPWQQRAADEAAKETAEG